MWSRSLPVPTSSLTPLSRLITWWRNVFFRHLIFFSKLIFDNRSLKHIFHILSLTAETKLNVICGPCCTWDDSQILKWKVTKNKFRDFRSVVFSLKKNKSSLQTGTGAIGIQFITTDKAKASSGGGKVLVSWKTKSQSLRKLKPLTH